MTTCSEHVRPYNVSAAMPIDQIGFDADRIRCRKIRDERSEENTKIMPLRGSLLEKLKTLYAEARGG